MTLNHVSLLIVEQIRLYYLPAFFTISVVSLNAVSVWLIFLLIYLFSIEMKARKRSVVLGFHAGGWIFPLFFYKSSISLLLQKNYMGKFPSSNMTSQFETPFWCLLFRSLINRPMAPFRTFWISRQPMTVELYTTEKRIGHGNKYYL